MSLLALSNKVMVYCRCRWRDLIDCRLVFITENVKRMKADDADDAVGFHFLIFF